MGSSQQQRFRVQLSDGERSVEGIEGLLDLARASVLSPTTRICREGKEDWIMAERIPALRLHFSTTSWGALEGLEVAAETDEDEPTDIEDLPLEALEPMVESGEPERDAASVEDLPLGALTPVGSPQMVIHSDNRTKRRRRKEETSSPGLLELPPEPMSATSGEIIEFPIGSVPESDDQAHPILDALQRLESKKTREAPKSEVRWRGLALMALIMFGGVGLMAWYLETEATVTMPVVPDDPSVQQQLAEVSSDELAELEEELREDLQRREGLHLVSRGPKVEKNEQDQRVEKAIKDDLQLHLMIQVSSVFANVISVKTGADRMPREVQLEVSLKSDASRLNRDLAAVGLVVGRFITDYNIELVRSEGLPNQFRVKLRMGNSGSMKVVRMDWRETRKLFKRSITLEHFLEKGVAH